MSWFKRDKPPAGVVLPFPDDRLAALHLIFHVAVERAVRLRQDPLVRNDQVIQSTLFTAYLCGFGRFFDERDARLGGIIGFALLRMFYPEAECQQRYDRVGELIADDQSVRAAFTLAGEYGASYFEALLQQRDADERATQNLILLIRTSKGSLLVELYVESHRCNLVDGITISSSDRDYLNNDAIVENAIDEPVTHRPELDLIAVRHSAQTRCGNTGIG